MCKRLQNRLDSLLRWPTYIPLEHLRPARDLPGLASAAVRAAPLPAHVVRASRAVLVFPAPQVRAEAEGTARVAWEGGVRAPFSTSLIGLICPRCALLLCCSVKVRSSMDVGSCLFKPGTAVSLKRWCLLQPG